ncbi:hypothetical protein [Methylobacterium aquaticum]|uniref:Uncharacterized protein n=1 Tax=Methylobacterium aquaticum TaxID=270351 RepID=A0A0C6G2K3_9HYPH|nr:hypothetical protein [Methylobacterium aquaticum]BAQ50370.1 hypothetical protein Maq22A_4p60060 [Methylobacterium aquaticum]
MTKATLIPHDLKTAAIGALAGLLLGLAYAVNYAEAYRDDLVDDWIGDRSILANVAIGAACPQATVCMTGPRALILNANLRVQGADGAGVYLTDKGE